MGEISENNKRIARNTVMLYVRMLFSMFVSFYTSRVILDVLGVTDYGINNVVAGVAGMFSFLNTSLAGATSRFLTYNLGQGNNLKLKQTFSAALTIHLILAFVIFILCETIGLWLLETKLVIPGDRMFAARVIYQFSVLSCLLMITQVPYNAALIAHERMDIFAMFGIGDVSMKLVIVLLLDYLPFDKLITYGFLFLLLSSMFMMLYRWYGYRHYEECRFRITLDKDLLKPMFVFSGWDVYGNLSLMLKGQGINVVQNMFWGPAINAATGVANQVMNAIMGFSRNFTTAIQPQIVKMYSQNNILEMQKLAIRCAKFSFYMLFLISFPAFLKVDDVMAVWLKEVPDYAFQFCQLAIVYNWVDTIMQPLIMIIHATGQMKRISLISGSIFLMALPITYLFLSFGTSPVTPFVVNIFIVIGVCMNNLAIVKKYITKFDALLFIKDAILYPFFVVGVGAIIPLVLVFYFKTGWSSFFIVCAGCVISELVSIFLLGLSNHEKIIVTEMLAKKLKINKTLTKK